MPWAAAAAVVGAGISAYGANQAADTQASAADAASRQQMDMYNQGNARQLPFLQAGQNASGQLSGLMGSNGANGLLTSPFSAQQYQQSPGYQFQMDQGLQAVNNSASARGGVDSGNTLKALTGYGQGLANQDYYKAQNAYQGWQNQVYGMLNGISRQGQAAASGQAEQGNAVGQAVANNTMGAGNAQAAGQVGFSNDISKGLQSGSNLALMYQMGGFGGGGGGGVGGSSGGYPSSYGPAQLGNMNNVQMSDYYPTGY